MSAIMMVCPRDYVLRSTTGQTIAFKANVPTPVPEMMYVEALSRNIVPSADAAIDTDEKSLGKATVQITGPLRDALVYQAINELVQRNLSDDFDGGGQPKPGSIETICGVKMSSQERTKYWNNYREIIGSNAELPNHPNVQLVQELQSLTSRKQLLEFASDNSYAMNKIEGLNNRELKAALLSMVINNKQSTVSVEATRPGRGSAGGLSGGLEEG